jgi:ppGpp synthetase/RelA/SpoT-type nucleotidyltranferase
MDVFNLKIHQANSHQHPGYLEASSAYTSAFGEYNRLLKDIKDPEDVASRVTISMFKHRVKNTVETLNKLNNKYFS